MTQITRLSLVALALGAGAAARAAALEPTVNPCALVTRDEARTAVGGAVAEGKLTTAPPGQIFEVSACSYRGGGISELKVTVYQFPPAQKQGIEVYRARCKQKEAAPGLGDVACWYNARHDELQVLKDMTLVVFKLDRSGSTSEPLIAVAKQALERLR
jgi:hypothetical protein